VRCKVRDAQTYDAEVDRITAGTAATYGRFEEDNTVRYIVNPKLRPDISTVHNIIAANKALHRAQDEEFQSFWDRKTPDWNH
jgi:hypothetical protein